MWWKLAALALTTIVLIVAIIPIRTHATLLDPAAPPPTKLRLAQLISNMYLTPGTVVLIGCILAVAIYLAMRLVRG